MKKYKLYIGIALISSVLGSSCSKDFLNQSPTNAVPEEVVFNSVANAETVINGTWGYLMETFNSYANPGYSAILRTSDAMGSDVAILTSKYGYPASYQFVDASDRTTGRVSGFWNLLYKVIDNTNNIIARIDNVPGDDNKRRYIKGQALVLRSYCYLTLASFYQLNVQTNPNAKTVPLYTAPTNLSTVGKPRVTNTQLYEQIFSDLDNGRKLLAGYVRGNTSRYKIDTSVANGLLARASLNAGKWNDAASYAANARKGYTLMPAADYYGGFNNSQNVEWIWGHGQRPDQSNASYSFHFLDVSSPGSYYYSFRPDPFFMERFDKDDIRSKLFSWDTLPGREGLLRYDKFRFKDDQTGDIVLMRASEMILIEAEAAARNNDLTTAATRLNELRNVRNAKQLDITGKSQQEVINEVLVERRKELWGEGFSLSDILRTGGTVVRKEYLDANNKDIVISVPRADGTVKKVIAKGHTVLRFPNGTPFVANSPYYIFAIPDAEYRNNPNLDN